MADKEQAPKKYPLPPLGKAESIREHVSYNPLKHGLINPESVIGRLSRGKSLTTDAPAPTKPKSLRKGK